MCSEWAPREPSLLRIVQPSGSVKISSVVCRNHGSMAMTRPGLQPEAAVRRGRRWHVRVAVHGPPHAVTAELGVDPQPCRAGDLPIATEMSPSRLPGTATSMAASSARSGGVDQVEVALVRRTDDQAEAESATQPSTEAAKSTAEQVAVAQRVVVREPVEHGVVTEVHSTLPKGIAPNEGW